MNLHNVLLKKASHQELGHFYILETSAPQAKAHEILITFVRDFIRDYYQQIEGHKQSLTNLMDHPDVLVIGSTLLEEDDKKDHFFKVEMAQTLNRFFEFKPVQGIRKFAVITEGHRINTIVANKWLKLLEEPQGVSTIFLLNPQRQQLLPTIHSRAIHLRLPSGPEQLEFTEWNKFLEDMKNMTLSQFLDHYSRGHRDLAFWVNQLIHWESEQLDKPTPKGHLTQWMSELKEMEVFHQPTATKWTLFYTFIKDNVLIRK
jgi:hypothetical protein